MDADRAILRQLADGGFHSGEELARSLGVSRAAVWKRIRRLGDLGLGFEGERGRGYRLTEPFDLLDADAIRAALRQPVSGLDVLFDTPSTNQQLLDAPAVHGRAILAEYQHAGRGRRGRRWLCPPGSGICLSVGWHFSAPPASLMLLSLLAGVCAVRALERCGCPGARLKWPNDLMAGNGKLGGVLIESRGQIAGPVDAVIGIGLNVRLPPAARAQIDQPAADLADLGATLPSRNALAAALIDELVEMLSSAGTPAWDRYLAEWHAHDAGRGREARLLLPGGEVRGRVEGVDASGLLLLRTDGGLQRYSTGELSLRLEP